MWLEGSPCGVIVPLVGPSRRKAPLPATSTLTLWKRHDHSQGWRRWCSNGGCKHLIVVNCIFTEARSLPLLGRSKLVGWQVEALIGHCTFAGLLGRGSLSAFHCSYQFMCHSHPLEVPIWSEVAAELQCCFTGISPWQNRWNDYAYLSDASLKGCGIRVVHWPQSRASWQDQ